MSTEKLRYELELYDGVLRVFRRKAHCFSEVPFFGKSVDLVFAGTALRNLHAVEVKLGDWRSALKQASVNQLFAHYSYIAVPEVLACRLCEKEMDLFTNHGVGIIAVNGTGRIALPALRSRFIYRKHRETVADTLLRTRFNKPKSLEVVTNAIIAGRRTRGIFTDWVRQKKRTSSRRGVKPTKA